MPLLRLSGDTYGIRYSGIDSTLAGGDTVTTAAKTPAGFLAQAVPWLALFALWAVLSLALGLVVVLPLKLVSWACRGIVAGVEMFLAAIFAVLFAVRPVPPGGKP